MFSAYSSQASTPTNDPFQDYQLEQFDQQFQTPSMDMSFLKMDAPSFDRLDNGFKDAPAFESLDNSFNKGFFKSEFNYPATLSPPGTPVTHYNPADYASSEYSTTDYSSPANDYSAAANDYSREYAAPHDQSWSRQRSESISWTPDHSLSFNSGISHQRAMSMPHISGLEQFSMMQMNFALPKPHLHSSNRTLLHSRKGSVGSITEGDLKCTAPGCDRTFSRPQNLRSHLRCHLVTAPHPCQSCPKSFRRTTDLQRHIRTMHLANDQKPWACLSCPKKFGRSDALKRHLASKKGNACCGEVLATIKESVATDPFEFALAVF
jgi:hypothetical protein